MNDLVYRKQLPTEVGWYWLLSPNDDPHIVYVREYAGNLAIGNYSIVGWPRMVAALWAGPIPEPLMPQEKE